MIDKPKLGDDILQTDIDQTEAINEIKNIILDTPAYRVNIRSGVTLEGRLFHEGFPLKNGMGYIRDEAGEVIIEEDGYYEVSANVWGRAISISSGSRIWITLSTDTGKSVGQYIFYPQPNTDFFTISLAPSISYLKKGDKIRMTSILEGFTGGKPVTNTGSSKTDITNFQIKYISK